MKKILSLFILMIVLVTGFASATVAPLKCGGMDICTWTTSGNPDYGLPLGSQDNSGCGLYYNTFWSVNTDAVATCVFDGSNLEDVMLYLSIDNDVIKCTLNGNEVVSYTSHENCAPLDPMNGYQVSLTPQMGSNTLVCEVRDRGVMSHFDACVVGEPITPIVPEFGALVGILTLMGALGVFFVVRKK